MGLPVRAATVLEIKNDADYVDAGSMTCSVETLRDMTSKVFRTRYTQRQLMFAVRSWHVKRYGKGDYAVNLTPFLNVHKRD